MPKSASPTTKADDLSSSSAPQSSPWSGLGRRSGLLKSVLVQVSCDLSDVEVCGDAVLGGSWVHCRRSLVSRTLV